MKYPSLDEIFVAVKGHVDCFSENVVESIVKNLLSKERKWIKKKYKYENFNLTVNIKFNLIIDKILFNNIILFYTNIKNIQSYIY